jgi:nuclease S1
VRFFDRGTNLHAVWDTGILQRAGKQWEQLARELNGRLTTEDAKKHTEHMQPEAWAQEAYRIVVAQVYAGVSPGAKLSQSYVDEKLPLVEQQLSIAGLRLAWC